MPNYYFTNISQILQGLILNKNRDNETMNLDLTDRTLSLDLTTWNTYKVDAITNGTLRVIVNGAEFYSQSFEFLPHWQPNDFHIDLSNLPNTVNYIQISVTNNEQQVGTLLIYGEVPNPQGFLGLAIPLTITLAVAIPVIVVILIKSGRLHIKRLRASD